MQDLSQAHNTSQKSIVLVYALWLWTGAQGSLFTNSVEEKFCELRLYGVLRSSLIQARRACLARRRVGMVVKVIPLTSASSISVLL
jgi:hypothetical protein